MINRFLLFVCTILLCTASYAGEKPTQDSPSKVTQEMSGVQPNPALFKPLSSQKDIEKYVWMAQMKKRLPTLLCNDDHYFLTCFETNPKQCKKMSAVFLGACLDKAISDLPSHLAPEQQAQWGQTMGRCTYDLYNTFMADLKTSEPACTVKEQKKTTSLKKTKASQD